MDAIVAVNSDWGIGRDGTQTVVLKADRARFKELTEGKTVIVGRKTLADFPGGRPLKNRRNIVVTGQDILIDGAEVAHSVTEALELCGGDGLVIGGASVYREFYPLLDRVFVTKLEVSPESDSFFPDLDESAQWALTECSEPMSENGVSFVFAVYERIHDNEA